MSRGNADRPGSNAAGIAVMSRTGTCFRLKYSVGDGVQTFGVGSPCTGRAALGAASEAGRGSAPEEQVVRLR